MRSRGFGTYQVSLLLVGVLSLGACGGKSAGHSPGGDPPSPMPSLGCAYEGKTYADGDSFRAMDGCNSCSCEDGRVACTEIGCDPDPGPTQPPISCEQVGVFYEQLLEDAKRCDPHESESCSYRVSTGLGCGCDTFVNPQNWNKDLAAAYASHYQSLGCGSGIACGMCAQPPVGGQCTMQGRCADAAELKAGPGCKVGGVVYADGSSDIPDPVSCNLCSCNAGQLACTDKACPKPCPAGTKLATSCAQCGPTDACQVVEHACYPACTDSCATGACIDGACLTGICG